jgi:mannonate dehydratase
VEPTWRWFGQADPISLTKIRQAGASGVVTALHDVAPGQVWPRSAIASCKATIEAAGLSWSVVESLPVAEGIRLREPSSDELVAAYSQSLCHLGEAGVRTVCYNFMPVLDWTRTNLSWRSPTGAATLRFDATQWAAFDLFLLQRPNATRDYSADELARAEQYFAALQGTEQQVLVRNIAAGLPGANVASQSLESLREVVARWSAVTERQLRDTLVEFLNAIVPVCEQYDIRLCLHPDDPPRRLLGLPRVASCIADFERLFARVPSPNHGLTLCVGSLGAGRANDPVSTAEQLAARVYFAHLRSVRLERDGSFVETGPLEGDTNLVEILRLLVAEERRRRGADAAPTEIPMRPDHGQLLEGDSTRLPGYAWLGRLKALSELRGLVHAVEQLTQPAWGCGTAEYRFAGGATGAWTVNSEAGGREPN